MERTLTLLSGEFGIGINAHRGRPGRQDAAEGIEVGFEDGADLSFFDVVPTLRLKMLLSMILQTTL